MRPKERGIRRRRAAANLGRTTPRSPGHPTEAGLPARGAPVGHTFRGRENSVAQGSAPREWGAVVCPAVGGTVLLPGAQGHRREGAPRTSGGKAPTSLTAPPPAALAVAVIHAVQDDEGKGEEAKLHLGGRAGERRLSESGNWRAHRRRGAGAARCWEDAEEESPGARGQRWSVPRGRHLPALTLRPGGETGWVGVESPREAAASARVPTSGGAGGGSELLARHWARSSFTRAHSCL